MHASAAVTALCTDRVKSRLQTVLSPLANTIHENITVNGKTWKDHIEHTNQGTPSHLLQKWENARSLLTQPISFLSATQPVDSALLKETIQTQDAAFQLSSGNALKRISKATQLASQVDGRIARVIKSGQEKTDILEAQRIKREASLVVQGEGKLFCHTKWP